MQNEIDQKFPLEALEQYQAVELVAVVGWQTRENMKSRSFGLMTPQKERKKRSIPLYSD